MNGNTSDTTVRTFNTSGNTPVSTRGTCDVWETPVTTHIGLSGPLQEKFVAQISHQTIISVGGEPTHSLPHLTSTLL